MKLNTYLVCGEHPHNPGIRHHVELSMDAAVAQAVSMVSIICDDVAAHENVGVDEDIDDPTAWNVTAENWQGRLLWAQCRVAMRERCAALPLSYAEARALLEPMTTAQRYEEAGCDVWIETHEVRAPATIQVWHAFSDVEDNGSDAFACLSEREGQDWLLEQFGQDREAFDHFMATGAHLDNTALGVTKPEDRDLNEFIRHVCDGCDSWGLTSSSIPVPMVQPAKLAIEVDGGNVTAVYSEVPVEVVTVDSDTDGIEEERCTMVPRAEGDGEEEAYLAQSSATVDAARVDMIFALFGGDAK